MLFFSFLLLSGLGFQGFEICENDGCGGFSSELGLEVE